MLGERGKAFPQAADEKASCRPLLSDALNPFPDPLPYSGSHQCMTAVEPRLERNRAQEVLEPAKVETFLRAGQTGWRPGP